MLYEVNQIPNNDRKHRIIRLCDKASHVVTLDYDIYALAEKLKHLGIKSYDALHLSCAKIAGADVFLSTNDKLVKKSQKNKSVLDMTVDNPLNWLRKIW